MTKIIIKTISVKKNLQVRHNNFGGLNKNAPLGGVILYIKYFDFRFKHQYRFEEYQPTKLNKLIHKKILYIKYHSI